ncbi:Carboxypeptidase B [Galemys pyrenaicus]|uniref:Carboxypeptidase B n=1 Tax=Galemys pyrenaicus TaxID=202257 RepID=A0A8J6A223_GALPY|nr:Carboxypeptidase B [Galemys pyrenaicus]
MAGMGAGVGVGSGGCQASQPPVHLTLSAAVLLLRSHWSVLSVLLVSPVGTMLVFLVLLSVALASTHHDGEHFEGEKVFRVNVAEEDHINLLQKLASFTQIDFWKPDSVTQIRPHSTVDFRVKADDVITVEEFLDKNELNYEVLINNLRSALETQFDNQVRATGHSYVKYNNWETIEAWTEQIASENPSIVSRSIIGTTFEGRNMYLLKIGKPGSTKPAIFMDCGFHAREWISPAFCQWFVKEAVRTYGRELHMTELLDKLDFYVLPVVNIDGYVFTWTKNRMWRKTRSTHAGSSCIGTDPNRNFNAGWCKMGASHRPCDDTYCGPTAESEKETKALADFIRQHLSSIKAYLTIHSYSQMMLYPYSYDYKVAKNNEELNALAKATVKELATLHGTKYTYGPGATTIYPAAGGSDDWAYDQGIKYSFTFELRDKGKYGFTLPESQIQETCEETMLAIKHVAQEKVFRVKPQDDKQAELTKDLAKTNQFDLWYPDAIHHIVANVTIDFQVNEKESQFIQAALDQNKMHYEILIHDLQEEVEKQFDIVAWTKKMVEKYPKMITHIKIGTTVEDNPLYVLKIGEKDKRRKAIFMDCGIHAREWVSLAFCQWFVYQTTKIYGKDKIMTKLLDQMNFYVLPVFNVDGYIWSWTQDCMWRENRSKNWNSKSIGTDLNRNFNVSWNSFSDNKNPCGPLYHGLAPESEEETKAVTDFIRRNQKSIFHSYTQIILFLYRHTSELPPDKGKFGFLLPESRIKSTCKETMLAVKYIAKYVLKQAS